MSVKAPPSLFNRLLNVLLSNWCIEFILMLFIVGSMVSCNNR